MRAAEIQNSARTGGGRWWQVAPGSNPETPFASRPKDATIKEMLTDGVITLHHPTMDDVDAICAGAQDPEVPKWTNVPSPYTRGDAIWWVERTIEERASGTSQAFLAFLDGGFAASCSLM